MRTLTTILREYPAIGPLRPDVPPTLHRGFSGADVWKVQTESGEYAARQWPAGWSPLRTRGLHALLQFLRDCGLEYVASPLPLPCGKTLVNCAERLWHVEPWLPGRADYHEQPHRHRLSAAVQAMARWHVHAIRFVPADNVRAWFGSVPAGESPAISERLEKLRSLSIAAVERTAHSAMSRTTPEAQALLDHLAQNICRFAPVVQMELQSASRLTVHLQPVLRDVWHDHVLFTGDAVTGLIDASACRTESVAADLARLLGSLVGDDVAAWDFALAEYQRVRPLTLSELALIPVLDRSGVLLSAVTWLEWLGPQQRVRGDDPRVMPRLRELAQRFATT